MRPVSFIWKVILLLHLPYRKMEIYILLHRLTATIGWLMATVQKKGPEVFVTVILENLFQILIDHLQK